MLPNRSAQNDPFLIDGHKMLWHYDRINAWAHAKTIEEKAKVYPIYVEVSPVGYCNHRCTFCAVDYIGYVNRRIDTAVLCHCLGNMAACGVKSVMFAGEGEPMLHHDIIQITNHAKEVGLDVAFTTNGSALTRKFADQALQSCKWIKVSINGGSESYGLVHRVKQGEYERIWDNLQYAVTQNRRFNSNCAIGVQCVVLLDNLRDIPGIVQRAKETGVTYIVLKPYSQHKKSHTHAYEKVSYQEEQIRTVLQEAKAFETQDFKVIVRTNAMEEWDEGSHTYSKCLATPYFWAYIMATGDVYGCSAYLLDDRFCYGNINAQSFQEVWEGPKRLESIKYVEEKLDISECRINCRMNQVNKHLTQVVSPNPHANFI